MWMLLWKRASSGCLPALAEDSPDRIRLPADAFCLGKEPLKDTGHICTGNTTEKTGRKNGFRRDPLLTKEAAASIIRDIEGPAEDGRA